MSVEVGTQVVASLEDQVNGSAIISKEDAQSILDVVAVLPQSLNESSTGSSSSASVLNVTRRMASVVEAALDGVVLGLMSNLSSTQVNKTQVLVVEAGAIQMTAAAIPFAAAGDKAELPANIPLANGLSASALAAVSQASAGGHIGISTCRWKGLNPFGPASDGSAEAIPACADVVSLSLSDGTGKPVTVQDLSEPLVLAIPLSKVAEGLSQDEIEAQIINGTFPQCRWWDGKQWLGSGCKILSLQKDGSELLCACTHLTSFSAFSTILPGPDNSLSGVFNPLEAWWQQILFCSRAGALFTSEGFAQLQQGSWASQEPSTGFYLFAVLGLLALLAAVLIDCRNSEELLQLWSQMTHVHWFDMSFELWGTYEVVSAPRLWPQRIAKNLVEMVAASSLGVCQGTLQILEEATREARFVSPRLADQAGKRWFRLSSTVPRAALRLKQQRAAMGREFSLEGLPDREVSGLRTWLWHLTKRIGRLVLRTFYAGHPIRNIFLVDLYTLMVQRTLLRLLELLGAVFVGAFYFHRSGVAVSPDAPAQCVVSSLTERMQYGVPVALVSSVVATIPSSLLYMMVSARPREEEQKSEKLKDALLVALFYLVGILLCSFYLLFLAAFLASVDVASGKLWLTSVLCTVLSTMVAIPLGLALVLVAVAVITLQRDSELRERLCLMEWKPSQEPQQSAHNVTRTRVLVVKPAADTKSSSILPGQVADSDFNAVIPQPGSKAEDRC